jgi:hypothetical protein
MDNSYLFKEFQIWKNTNKQIDIPEKEIMRIPLIDGHESFPDLRSRTYPVLKRNRNVIDKNHDKLYDQSRMEFIKDPLPFAFPYFVVWKRVYGKDKFRMVTDFRPFNRVTIPDVYPLPLQ